MKLLKIGFNLSLIILIIFSKYTYAQAKTVEILPGSFQMNEYLPLLKGKKVAIVGNHTSLVNKSHLLDTLLSKKIMVKAIFCPEHGFRGTADAGEKVSSYIDSKTNIPVISLYGKNKKPSTDKLKDIDVIIFDLQDVGVRFYTYISTLHYVMEAALENNKKLIVLDRPNPNGMYIDGPVLDDSTCKSFVGIHPIPIVYGLTIGELAYMINGEQWLGKNKKCNLTVIKCKNYTHKSKYSLPVKPSPNLPNDLAIALYPSLCLFEGTSISMARGTYFPFQAIGYPDSSFGSFRFVPNSISGMSKDPIHLNKTCYGYDFRNNSVEYKFELKYLIEYYQKWNSEKDPYFNPFFDKLVGNRVIKQMIQNNSNEIDIRLSWKKSTDNYKIKRKKYLFYSDFE